MRIRTHGSITKRDGLRRWWYVGRWVWSIQATFGSRLRLWGVKHSHYEHGALGVFLWPLMLWFSVERPGQDQRPRSTGIDVRLDRELAVSVSWRADAFQWPLRFGWEWRVSLSDVVLGRAVYREDPSPKLFAGMVRMPEGAYPCHGTIARDSWKRPRWFRRTVSRAHLDMDTPVPHPGKGENSWDCDEDATYGLTCPAATAEEAIQAMVDSVMRSRSKYGSGVAWRPAAK